MRTKENKGQKNNNFLFLDFLFYSPNLFPALFLYFLLLIIMIMDTAMGSVFREAYAPLIKDVRVFQ